MNAPHAERAFALYPQLLGWSRTAFVSAAMPSSDGRAAVLSQGSVEMAAHWLPYLQVDSLSSARARARATRLGGLIGSERRSSSGAAVVLRDPLGAIIAICELTPHR